MHQKQVNSFNNEPLPSNVRAGRKSKNQGGRGGQSEIQALLMKQPKSSSTGPDS